VITYFLLCGYTPFDRDSNLEEMQAIMVADYSFTPIEYWRDVSETARDFIRRCLTIDPKARMTAHQALSHNWIKEDDASAGSAGAGVRQKEVDRKVDLLPTVRKNFNARVKLHAAIDTIRAINQLRAGQGAALMNGARSNEPNRGQPGPPLPAQPKQEEMEGVEGTGQLGSTDVPQGENGQSADKMDIDPRGHGHGQTEMQIREQERRIRETTASLWGKR
jgi:calcium/calmodulin-dependent protein kinase I